MKGKKLIILFLVFAACSLGIGYAALSTTLKINGTGNIDTTWKIDITNYYCNQDTTITMSGTTFNVAVDFSNKSDTLCTVAFKNSGTLKAKVNIDAAFYKSSSTSTDCPNATVWIYGWANNSSNSTIVTIAKTKTQWSSPLTLNPNETGGIYINFRYDSQVDPTSCKLDASLIFNQLGG